MAIADDLVGHAHVSYLGDPFEQYCGLNGKPLIGGWIEVYQAGTDTKYITMQNFDGAMNPFKVPLNADGRVVMLADPSLTYDMYVRNSYGDLVCSRLNVECTCPGNISIKGLDTWVRNTDGTLDVSLQTSANNRRVFTVNTRSKLLDVQEPLYFVENSNTATVIGFSGDGYLTEDKFEYDNNNNITAYNHSAFAGGGGSGPDYEAGDHIDITNSVISVTGLPTSSDVENAISSAVTNIENKFEYNENNYITAYNNSAFAGTNYSAGDYVSIENNTINVTGLQPSGDYATKTELVSATSGKQDTLSAGEGIQIINNTISVTAHGGGGITTVNHDNTLSGNGNSEPLGLANAEDYVKQDDLTAYATTALVSSVSSELYSAFSGISGDYALVAGSGVELVDDPNAKTTTINVTAEGTPVTAIEQMIESATSGISAAISGSYTLVAGNGIQLTDDDNARTTTVSVSGDYLTTADSANFYPSDNPSGFISEVPNTYLQNTDLTITDGKVTEISGVPLSAGDELPSGVMNTSALEYNAVNEISGYNGSAIAQYGAEKQWLVHDDTLVHASNSAQYALGVNLSAVAQLLGVDETVLWSGNAAVSNCTLAEPITNFNSVKFLLYGREDTDRTRMWFECETTNDTWNIQYADGTNYAYTQFVQLSSTNTTLSAIRYKEINYGPFNSTTVSITGETGTYPTIIKAVVGIGRKS